ncbi:MAG: MFS transporter [bacterium]
MLPLVGLLLAVFLDLFGLGMLRPVLPLYVQETFGVDVLRVSWIPAAFGVGKLLADVPAGLLMNRVGHGRMMAAGLALVATADILSGLEPAFPRFLLWRSLAGMGFGFFVTTAAIAVLDLAPATRRGRYMGSYLLIGDVGAVLGAVGGGWVYEQLGPRIPFFVKAVLAASAALLAREVSGPSTIQAGGVRGGVRAAVGLPGLLPISVVNMVLFMADVGILAILFPLFLHARGLPPRVIGLFVALTISAQLAALVVGGRLADRWGKVPVLGPALCLYASGLVALSMTRSSEQILFAAVVIGLGSGVGRAVPVALVGDLSSSSQRGAAMGVFRAFTDIGMISGPVLLGLLAARAGYGSAFFATAGLLIASAGMLVLTRRKLLGSSGSAIEG